MSLPFLVVKKTLELIGNRKRKCFIEACKDPESSQKIIKREIEELSNSPFSEEINSFDFYQDKQSLTKEKVEFYETTSGSSGSKKAIPYTKSFLKSFENMFILWAHDLVLHGNLNLKTGIFFMSVSPKIGEKLKDDRKYLSPVVNFLLTPFLASNPNDHKAKSSHEFLHKIAKDLINSPELEIISVWSPTYLLSLLEFMDNNRSELGLKNSQKLNSLWPKLKLISCWTHAQAERPAKLLAEKFTGIKIQSKGLLLTEGAITIPWTEAQGNLPLLTETYLEFISDDKSIKLLHELETNKVYRVVMSQKNGFLRYDTRDLIKVTGHYFKTPVLEFVGRAEAICDLAGEKISEIILQSLFKNKQSTLLLVPDTSKNLPGYELYIDQTESSTEDWEMILKQNYHYELARKLGQLNELKVIKVPDLAKQMTKFYQSRGMVLGDIKEKILIYNLEEAMSFRKWSGKDAHSSH